MAATIGSKVNDPVAGHSRAKGDRHRLSFFYNIKISKGKSADFAR
jgi:hypothetical protein